MSNDRHCPILDRVIDEGYCYDITTMAYGFIKPQALTDKLNRENAKTACDSCPFNEYKE